MRTMLLFWTMSAAIRSETSTFAAAPGGGSAQQRRVIPNASVIAHM